MYYKLLKCLIHVEVQQNTLVLKHEKWHDHDDDDDDENALYLFSKTVHKVYMGSL